MFRKGTVKFRDRRGTLLSLPSTMLCSSYKAIITHPALPCQEFYENFLQIRVTGVPQEGKRIRFRPKRAAVSARAASTYGAFLRAEASLHMEKYGIKMAQF